MLPTALATDDFLKREVPRKNQRIFELLTGFCAAGDACVSQLLCVMMPALSRIQGLFDAVNENG